MSNLLLLYYYIQAFISSTFCFRAVANGWFQPDQSAFLVTDFSFRFAFSVILNHYHIGAAFPNPATTTSQVMAQHLFSQAFLKWEDVVSLVNSLDNNLSHFKPFLISRFFVHFCGHANLIKSSNQPFYNNMLANIHQKGISRLEGCVIKWYIWLTKLIHLFLKKGLQQAADNRDMVSLKTTREINVSIKTRRL